MCVLVTTWLIAWAVLAGPNGAPPAQEGSAPSAPAATAPAIAVRQTEPMRVAFIEHVGPYWTVGPLLTRVREYMLRHDQVGPMFVRYLNNPVGPAATRLRAEVGFIVAGDHEPELPFKVVRRPPELVAYLVVDGRSATTRHDYTAIHEWIQGHGHRAAGPITEIYDPVPSLSTTHRGRTEIQVALVDAVDTPLQSRPGAALVEEATTDEDAGSSRQGPSTATREEGPEPQAARSEPQRIQPVRELIAAKRFDRIAEQLMPDDRAIPVALQVWFGQMVFRIGAVAKGLEHVYSGEGDLTAAMVDAITHRYKTVSATFTLDPLRQAVVRVDVRTDPLAGRKRAIMRDVDRLLDRVALHSVDVAAAADELADIVQRLQDLMNAQCRKTPGAATP